MMVLQDIGLPSSPLALQIKAAISCPKSLSPDVLAYNARVEQAWTRKHKHTLKVRIWYIK